MNETGNGWKHISTAKKDGRKILVKTEKGNVRIASWEDFSDFSGWWCGYDWNGSNVFVDAIEWADILPHKPLWGCVTKERSEELFKHMRAVGYKITGGEAINRRHSILIEWLKEGDR